MVFFVFEEIDFLSRKFLGVYLFMMIPNFNKLSQLRLYDTPTASPQRGRTSPMSFLDMTQSNQMVRFQ